MAKRRNRSSRPSKRGFILSLLVLALLLAVGGTYLIWPREESAPEKDSVRLTILFESKGMLQEGSPVVYKESKIGTVRSIQLGESPSGPGGYYHADVAVDSSRLSILYHQMCVVVETEEGEAYVEFEDAPTETPISMRVGDTVIGSTRAGCTWEKMRRLSGEFMDRFAGTLEEYGIEAPSWLNETSVSLKNTNRKNIEAKVDHLRREAEAAGQTLEETFGNNAITRALLFKLSG